MQAEQQVDYQIAVEVAQQNGNLLLRFSDGKTLVWPFPGKDITPGNYYLIMSPTPVLPTKTELAQLVLQEIFKLDR